MTITACLDMMREITGPRCSGDGAGVRMDFGAGEQEEEAIASRMRIEYRIQTLRCSRDKGRKNSGDQYIKSVGMGNDGG